MCWYRVVGHCCALVAFISVLSFSTVPSQAQGLTRYGMWGDNVGRRRSTTPKIYKLPPPTAMLGANPALPRALRRKRKPHKPIELAEGGPRPDIKAKQPKTVTFKSDQYKPGDVVIDTKRRKLFLLLANEGFALAYPIAVGKRGFTWDRCRTGHPCSRLARLVPARRNARTQPASTAAHDGWSQ